MDQLSLLPLIPPAQVAPAAPVISDRKKPTAKSLKCLAPAKQISRALEQPRQGGLLELLEMGEDGEWRQLVPAP